MTFFDESLENAGFESQKTLINRLQWTDLTIFDIGGHQGESVEEYRRLFPQCEIHTFEPHPDSFQKLEKQYQDTPQTVCHHYALGPVPGTATLHATRCTTASSLLRPEEFLVQISPTRKWDFSTVQVPVKRLDAVVGDLGIPTIHILKIDVQGMELDVLKSGESLLDAKAVKLIYTEAQFAETYENQTDFSELCLYLKSFGYVLWDLFPFLHTTSGRLWTANALFVSNELVPLVTLLPQPPAASTD